MFRWLFGHRNSSYDSRDLDTTTYNPPRRTSNRYANHDFTRSDTHFDSYDPGHTADTDFLDDLDHFDNDF